MSAEHDTSTPTAEGTEPEGEGGANLLFFVVLGAILLIPLVAVGGWLLVSNDEPASRTVTYIVEPGTAARIAKGEQIQIMPPELQLKVGDSLVVRNDDKATMTVGPYTVDPGQTLNQRFQRPQTLIGDCSLSSTGEVRIVVT